MHDLHMAEIPGCICFVADSVGLFFYVASSGKIHTCSRSTSSKLGSTKSPYAISY